MKSKSNIITLIHKHSKSYIVCGDMGCVMFDAGWVNSFPFFSRQMKEQGIKLNQIKYLFVSHFHIDHAGLVQLLKNYGVKLLMHEVQKDGIEYMNNFFIRKPDKEYIPINDHGNTFVTSEQSRALMKELGIDGEIIPTPEHSPDSISLVIDNECAFIGDYPIHLQDTENWKKMLSYNTKTIYPAHAETIFI